jgi:predicted ATPase
VTDHLVLTRLEIEGFRSLEKVELSPGPVTILIGPNGCGKSNILSALRMISYIRTRSLKRFVAEAGGASALLRYGPRVTRRMALRLDFEGAKESGRYEVHLAYAAGDTLFLDPETVSYGPAKHANGLVNMSHSGDAESLLQDLGQDAESFELIRFGNQMLSGLSHFHFHDTSFTSALRQNSGPHDLAGLRSDGSNLAGYLRSLQRATDEFLVVSSTWYRELRPSSRASSPPW